MSKSVKEKVALVTGASKGIGRAIALRLAPDGAAVVVNYAGSAQQAQETVGLIEQRGGRAVDVQADVSKVADVRRLFDACFEKFGRLDILVNNAGVMFTKPVVEVGEEEFDRIFAVNVKGAFFCCQEAAKRMAEGGRIINLSSSTTALMLPGYAAYVATKGAV
jgi:3-oxoacyl-[acyl-carrier protein] reductase